VSCNSALRATPGFIPSGFALTAAASQVLSAALLLSLLLAAAAAAQTAVPPATKEPDSAVAQARALIDAGQPGTAIEMLRPLAAAGNVRAGELLGVAYYHANDPARAIEQLQPIVPRLAPDSAEHREAVQVLGLSLYLAGRIAESIPYLEAIRAAVPGDAKLAYALGMAYAQTRQPAKARESIARTYQVAPDSAAAYLLSGQMMNRLELEDLAEAELRQAMRLAPGLPEVHYLLGQIAIFRSRLDEGLELLRQELAINPAHAMALYRIGDIYSRQSRWDDAIQALQRSVWINPYFSAPYILLGKAYAKTAQPAAAEEMFRRAIASDPNNKSAHYLLAQLLQQTGRRDDAMREFAIAERLQGDVK
jgi:tetratricopeptide (TPR) repeat protein